jgi:hypothetical protein
MKRSLSFETAHRGNMLMCTQKLKSEMKLDEVAPTAALEHERRADLPKGAVLRTIGTAAVEWDEVGNSSGLENVKSAPSKKL